MEGFIALQLVKGMDETLEMLGVELRIINVRNRTAYGGASLSTLQIFGFIREVFLLH